MRVFQAASLLCRGGRLLPFFHCSPRRDPFRVISMSPQHQQQQVLPSRSPHPSLVWLPRKSPSCSSVCFERKTGAKTNLRYRCMSEPDVYRFGEILIDKRQVFFRTNLSFALVNIRPVVPGHVLVTPKRLAKRFVDLTAEETADLWVAARHIGSKVESYFGASSLTFALQDGPEAGQTVPHVHVHILPRRAGDFNKNDDIYYAIEGEENVLNLDAQRRNRTMDEMAEEAEELRKLFPENH